MNLIVDIIAGLRTGNSKERVAETLNIDIGAVDQEMRSKGFAIDADNEIYHTLEHVDDRGLIDGIMRIDDIERQVDRKLGIS